MLDAQRFEPLPETRFTSLHCGDDAERYATLALEAHVACGDHRGITQARGLLRMLRVYD